MKTTFIEPLQEPKQDGFTIVELLNVGPPTLLIVAVVSLKQPELSVTITE